jgi:hypothetical protein
LAELWLIQKGNDMNESEFEALLEAARRRRLTPGEEAQAGAWLALHPERRAEWEAETQLSRLLNQVPDAAVSSNFTARVLQAARREAAAAVVRAGRPWWRELADRLRLRPAHGLAAALAVVAMGGWAWREARLVERQRHARDLAALSCAAILPEPQLLAADFDTLRRLPVAEDDELLAVLHEAASNP